MSEKINSVSSLSDNPEHKLCSIIDITLDMVQEYSMLAKTMALEIERVSSKDMADIEEKYVTKFLNVAVSNIRELIPESCFEEQDAMVLSNLLMASCFLWAHSALLQKHAGDIEAYKRILTNLFLNGLTNN
ncbi:MAG TPA: hypothetical protein PLN69_06405 [bacterium]|nr:hypothetical protein [bacterium]